MADDFGLDPSIVEQDRVQRGIANTNSTAGVGPDEAATAIRAAPLSGIPAATGMQTPQYTQEAAEHQQRAAILASSPPLANWAASADPAHVAAAKDDFPALAQIGSYLKNIGGSTVEDVGNSFVQGLRGIGQSAAGIGAGPRGPNLAAQLFDFGPEAAIAKTLFQGATLLPGAALAAITEPAARAIAPFVTSTAPIFPWESPKPLNTPEERLAEAHNILNLALAGTGSKAGAVVQRMASKGFFEPPEAAATDVPSPVGPSGQLSHYLATQDVAAVAQTQEAIAASKVHGRSPSTMENYLASQTGGRTVSVDPDALASILDQGHNPFPALTPQVTQSIATGEPLEVPMDHYLASSAGQPWARELNEATSFRDGAPSVQDTQEQQVQPADQQEAAPVQEAQLPEDITPEEAPRARTLAASVESSVDEVVQEQALRKLFQDPQALGMTESQFASYNNGIEEAIGDAKEAMTQKAYAAIRAERTEPFKEAFAQNRAKVEQELAQVPAVRARVAIAQGKGPLGEPLEHPLKLAKDDIGAYGRDLGLPARYFSKDGVQADDLAPLFGYSTGADMLRDLEGLEASRGEGRSITQHFGDMAKEQALERTRRDLGFDLSPQAMRDEAVRLVNSPKITDFLGNELQQLADAQGLPFNKDDVKSYALRAFDDKPVSQAINLKQLTSFVYKGGLKAEKALLKGDLPTAFLKKQQQYIHHLQLQEAFKFQKFWVRTQKQWGRAAKKESIAGTSQDALLWAKKVIAATGRSVRANPADLAAPGGHMELSSFAGEKNGQGADILAVPVPPVAPEAMSVGQYRDVAQLVSSLLKWGREENQVLRDGKKVDLEGQVQQGIDSLSTFDRNISDLERSDPTKLQSIDAARRNVDAWLVRMEQLMIDFGAGAGGKPDYESPFFQLVTKPLQERRAWALDKRTELAKHFGKVAKTTGAKYDKWLKQRLPAQGPHLAVRTADGSPFFVTNKDVVMAALHLGDEGAIQALIDGYSTDAATLEHIVHTYMTPEAWAAVRGTWDAFDILKPDIIGQYRARTGVTPTLVASRPFIMPDGTTNPGGYFPIRHDIGNMPTMWVKQADTLSHFLGSPQYVRALPANNYMTARTGAKGPIDKDFRSIYFRLNQTIHDLAYRDVLAQINRFLLNPKMVEAISSKYGPEYVAKLRTDLKDIAGSESRGSIETRLSRAIDWMSEGQQVNMIGFSPSTMLKHGMTAWGQALVELGAPRYLASVGRVMLDPVGMERQAMQESADVRHVLSTVSEDAYRQFLSISGQRTSLSKAALSYAFHFVATSNKLVAIPLYDAAKLKIAEENPSLSPESVQAGAGQIVRQVLGSAGASESPIMMRAGGGIAGRLMRLTNPFMTFLNHMYNRSREIPQNLGFAGQRVNIGRAMGIMAAYFAWSIYIDQSIARKTFSMGKDASHIFTFWAEGMAHQLAGGVPVLNMGVAAAIHALDKSEAEGDVIFQELGQEYGNTAKALVNHWKHPTRPWTQGELHSAFLAAGQTTLSPGQEAFRLEQFFEKLHNGREHDWATVLHDLSLGPDPKTVR